MQNKLKIKQAKIILYLKTKINQVPHLALPD